MSCLHVRGAFSPALRLGTADIGSYSAALTLLVESVLIMRCVQIRLLPVATTGNAAVAEMGWRGPHGVCGSAVRFPYTCSALYSTTPTAAGGQSTCSNGCTVLVSCTGICWRALYSPVPRIRICTWRREPLPRLRRASRGVSLHGSLPKPDDRPYTTHKPRRIPEGIQ